LFRAELDLNQSLNQKIEGKSLLVEGIIASLPEQRGESIRFHLKILQIKDETGRLWATPGLTRLSWYGKHDDVRPGERWLLKVRLKRPYGFRNPGGFDYEGWLFRHGIRATGYVLSGANNKKIKAREGNSINRIRYILNENIEQTIEGNYVPLIKALALGNRSGITSQQWQILRNSGTSHLLAISGLHIGLIAGISFFLARWLWSTSILAVTFMPSTRFAALFSLIVASIYAAMAGFSVPTQRALVMLLLVMVAMFTYSRMAMSKIILLSLFIILVIDPFALFAADFWLSFCAISVIAYGMTCRPGQNSFWWRWGRVQVLTAIGLTPLLVLWFQQVPLLTVFANIIAVPWVGFVVVPCVLIGSILLVPVPFAGKWLLQLGASALHLLWPYLDWIAQSKFSVWYLPSPTYWSVLAAIVGVAILLMPRGLVGRWIGCLWFLPLLFPSTTELDDGDFRFTLLDVGQGLAAVVETRARVLVYDTGARFSDRFDAGNAVLVPFLGQYGHHSIDTLIISHGDNDHIGGVKALFEKFHIDRLLTSVPELLEYPGKEMCSDGQGWQWNGVKFRIFHPGPGDNLSGNNRSCVLKVSSEGQAVLIAGDIEESSEQRIVGKYAEKLHANILVAPHHGSNTSSTTEFIKAVAPAYVLFSVGYRNRFGFPKEDIIYRYQATGAHIMETAQEGAIQFEKEGNGLTVMSYRPEYRRFWHTSTDD
jgi:competence protein ComEC